MRPWGEGVANWLHRVGKSESSGQEPLYFRGFGEQGLEGVHLGSLLYSNFKYSARILHFWNRGGQIYRACGQKLTGAKRGGKSVGH